MKVLFIIPPNQSYIEASASNRVDRKREHRPNIGIFSVASYLEKKRPQYQVRVIDAASEGYSLTELAQWVREFRPGVVGITALTFTLVDALAVAQTVKTIDPKVVVVLGGWHPTYYPQETLRQAGVDLVVIGEGEITFAELCDRLADDPRQPFLEDVAGIAYKGMGGEIIVNPPRPLIADLDELPPVNYHLVNINNYRHVLGRNAINLALQSSRGCPFACTFCDIRRSSFRQRSPEGVVAEILRWYHQGIHSFFFVDDNFVLNKKWTMETCELLAALGLDIDFKISARVDLPDLEMYQALKRSGCSRVNFGVESSAQNYLNYLDKGITPEQSATAFVLAHQAGLQGMAYMIVGFPHQSKEEMYAELTFLQRIRADFATFAVLSPYPKTALYSRLLKEGTISRDFWQDFAENPQPGFVMPIVSQKYSREELRRTQVRLTQRFYFNPQFLCRALLSIRNLSQAQNYAQMALNLAFGSK